ncbi:MAG TPA: hypothetical protein VE870_07575 [Bacteroidales bacterium]|nr:hypothetical protein [Bacteroidales bacterium]
MKHFTHIKPGDGLIKLKSVRPWYETFRREDPVNGTGLASVSK